MIEMKKSSLFRAIGQPTNARASSADGSLIRPLSRSYDKLTRTRPNSFIELRLLQPANTPASHERQWGAKVVLLRCVKRALAGHVERLRARRLVAWNDARPAGAARFRTVRCAKDECPSY